MPESPKAQSMSDIPPSPIPSETAEPQHPSKLPMSLVTPETLRLAHRVVERGRFDITGLVFTQGISNRKAILDGTQLRWLSPADLQRIMKYQEPCDPADAPPGFNAGDVDGVSPTPVRDSGLASAVEQLAVDLGCQPVNADGGATGWQVRESGTVLTNPLDAIRELVTSLRGENSSQMCATHAACAAMATPESQSTQAGLF